MPQFVYFIRPARDGFAPDNATEREQTLIGEHFQYLKRNYEAGRVSFVGRTTAPPLTGVAVFEAADQQDAERFTAEDPAIAGGVFIAITQPFSVVFR